MNIYSANDSSGQLWLRNNNNEIFPLEKALSGVFVKYKNLNTTFYNELTSNDIIRFDLFYDTLFIQTNTGFCFEKYYTVDSEIVPYNKINNYQQNLTFDPLDLDYWFDEDSKTIYYFEFSEYIPIQKVKDFSLIQFAFKFKKFDTVKSLNKELLNKTVYFWIHKPIGLNIFNGIYERPKLTFNYETKLFNVSFIVRNEESSLGLISINLKENEITEINTWIPYGEVMPFGFVPDDYQPDIQTYRCEDIIYGNTETPIIVKYFIDWGVETGLAGVKLDYVGDVYQYQIEWNGNTKRSQTIPYQNETLLINKTLPYPNTGTITLTAFSNAGWTIKGICPNSPLATPTPTPSQTPAVSTPTPTPTRTPTPTPTPAPEIIRSVYVAFD